MLLQYKYNKYTTQKNADIFVYKQKNKLMMYLFFISTSNLSFEHNTEMYNNMI